MLGEVLGWDWTVGGGINEVLENEALIKNQQAFNGDNVRALLRRQAGTYMRGPGNPGCLIRPFARSMTRHRGEEVLHSPAPEYVTQEYDTEKRP